MIRSSAEAAARKKIERVVHPSIGMSLGAAGLITSVKEIGEGLSEMDLAASTPYSPVSYSIALAIKEVALAQKGVKKAMVFCHKYVLSESTNAGVNTRYKRLANSSST